MNILQDITEMKQRHRELEQLLQELERSNRELSQFSYAVSHDLQAPVRSVRALTQLLVRREGGPPEDTSHLATLIEQASDGMQRLIESMLRYAQVGQGEPTRTRVCINSVVETVRATLAAPISTSNARIICKSLPEIEADPVQTQQVFENLIANAIKYIKAGTPPLIQIEGRPTEEGWLFTVTDNAEGIPLGQQHAIFEPLKRLHGSETPGTGLGLAMCRAIVLRHGGRIWAESEGAGQGSTFRFTVLRTEPRSHLADKKWRPSNAIFCFLPPCGPGARATVRRGSCTVLWAGGLHHRASLVLRRPGSGNVPQWVLDRRRLLVGMDARSK